MEGLVCCGVLWGGIAIVAESPVIFHTGQRCPCVCRTTGSASRANDLGLGSGVTFCLFGFSGCSFSTCDKIRPRRGKIRAMTLSEWQFQAAGWKVCSRIPTLFFKTAGKVRRLTCWKMWILARRSKCSSQLAAPPDITVAGIPEHLCESLV